MLYKLSSGIDRIEPLPFLDFEQADALPESKVKGAFATSSVCDRNAFACWIR
jgi:hypothetical protein